MAASYEWTDWHLTPTGWVIGSEKEDHKKIDRPTPIDCVKTIRIIEECNGYGPVHTNTQKTWENPNTLEVRELLEKFPIPTTRY